MNNSAVEWRFTAVPIAIGPLHYSILLFIPLLLVTAMRKWVVLLTFAYAYVAFKMNKRGLTLKQYLIYLRIKYVDCGEWKAF